MSYEWVQGLHISKEEYEALTYNTNGPVVWINISMMIGMTLAMMVRFGTRHFMVPHGLECDDFLCFIAYVRNNLPLFPFIRFNL